MSLRWLILFISCALQFGLWSIPESTYLKMSDIQPMVKQILELHVQHRHLNSNLTKKIIENYFYQFDPLKLYLLQSEVDSYLLADDLFYAEVTKQIENEDYSIFKELDKVIQKSIWRARRWRHVIQEQDLVDHKPEGNFSHYALDLHELQRRWFNYLKVRFADVQLNRKSIEDKIIEEEISYLTISSPPKPAYSEHALALHILQAIASSFDPHTSFISPIDAQQMRQDLMQEVIGVGIVFDLMNSQAYIREILPNSPAQECGKLQVGDQLIRINQVNFDHMSQDLQKIDFVLGREIEFEFKRLDQIIKVILQPAVIPSLNKNLHYQLTQTQDDKRIGYIALDTFYENNQSSCAEQDIIQAIQSMQLNRPMDALILDLRKNMGGFLDQAVKVAGLFMSNGIVAVTKYADGALSYYRDLDPKKAFSGPVVVLTSRLSASAAEIVAQTLQEYGIALVIGDSATFGKGTVQIQNFTKDEALNLYSKITVGHYYTVSGRSPQLDGVKVDVVVPGPYEKSLIGERFAINPILSDSIQPLYQDHLEDIDLTQKTWFLNNYLPSLQKRALTLVPFVSLIKENSKKRVQDFFQDKPFEKCTASELEVFQTQEAYKITEQLIHLMESNK